MFVCVCVRFLSSVCANDEDVLMSNYVLPCLEYLEKKRNPNGTFPCMLLRASTASPDSIYNLGLALGAKDMDI